MSLIKKYFIENFIESLNEIEENFDNFPSEEDRYRIWGITTIRDLLSFNAPDNISIEIFVFLADLFDEIIDPFDEYNKEDFERDYDSIYSLGLSLLPNTKYWIDKHPNCDE